jgi:lipoyl(octanoyl) transferase
MAHELWVCHLGVIEYNQAVALQERVRARRQQGELPDVLLMLEHPPVYTRGRRTAAGELPFGEEHYRALGIDVVDTRRGGRVTYHGPGQLVGYPIIAVDDVVALVRTIEHAIIDALVQVDVVARQRPGRDFTGVWVEDRKIASIGLHVAQGVTAHGFAVNVNNGLEPFSWVVPCGLDGVAMTSIAAERGAEVDFTCFRRRMAHVFAAAGERRQRLVSLARIDGAPAPAPGPAAAPLEVLA